MADLSAVTEESAREALARILRAPEFARSPRLSRFLSFLVEQTLAGRADELKEYLIGLEVFDRRQDFDPKLDSTVRTQASKLRDKLRQYYAVSGAADPVIIRIPTGRYVAEFEWATPPTVAVPRTRRRGIIVLVSTIVALLILGVAAFFIVRTRESVPITSDAGWEMMPAFSPDGTHIVFAHGSGTRHESAIYLQNVNDGTRRLFATGSQPLVRPVWSPDGSSIAVIRGRLHEGEVVILPVDSGVEMIVPDSRGASWVGWNPQTGELGFAVAEGGRAAVFAFDRKTGARRQITYPPEGSAGEIRFAYSPQGDRIALVRDVGGHDVFVQTLDSGRMERVTEKRRVIHGLDWTRDGSLVIALQTDQGVELLRATRLPLFGYVFRSMMKSSGMVMNLAVSPISRTIVFERHSSDLNLYSYQPSGTTKEVVPVQTSTWLDADPHISLDGNRIAFISRRSGRPQIWVSRSDGSQTEQVTQFDFYDAGSPRWSPDGRRIAFDTQKLSWAIQVLDLQSGAVRQLSEGWHDEARPSWSADGRWIYFHSNRGGMLDIWKRSAEGGPAIRVTSRGGKEPYEAADGKAIFFIKPGAGLWTVPVEGGRETLVHARILEGHWQPAVPGIYYLHDEMPGPAVTLNLLDPSTGRVTLLAQFPALVLPTETPAFTAAPDGSLVVFSQFDQQQHDLHMISF